MAFYKDRADFEAGVARAAGTGVWGVGRNAQWWFWRLLLGVLRRHGTVALNNTLLDVYTTDAHGKRIKDEAASADLHAQWGNVFGDVDELALLQGLQADIAEVRQQLSSGGRPKEVLFTRPKTGVRMFQPVNDSAERRWVSLSQAQSWQQGYQIVSLADDDPFWDLPNLTATAEAEADQIEHAQSGGQP